MNKRINWWFLIIMLILAVLYSVTSNNLISGKYVLNNAKCRQLQLQNILDSEEYINELNRRLTEQLERSQEIFSINNNIEFLNHINTILKELDIDAKMLKPSPEQDRGDHIKLLLLLELETDFEKLLKLINKIEYDVQYVAVDKLEIVHMGTGKKLNVKIELSTPYYKEI